MAQQIITGGFPIFLFSSEKMDENFSNIMSMLRAILTDDETMQNDLRGKVSLDDFIQLKKLPKLFTLLHFHAKYLKKGRKVGIVADGDKFTTNSADRAMLAWFEVDSSGSVLVMTKCSYQNDNGKPKEDPTGYAVTLD